MLAAIGNWIREFQRAVSTPVAQAVAEFARIPVLTLEDYERGLGAARMRAAAKLSTVGAEAKDKLVQEVEAPPPVLSLVMGPFEIVPDIRYTYWQGFKVVAADVTVVAPLCRLDNRGTGGVILLKLWYCQQGDYQYHGDPAAETYIPPDMVIHTICDHLANEYHVGFLENENQGVGRGEIQQSNRALIDSDAEMAARVQAEDEAKRRQ
jgi:hypothetical protein